MKRSLSIVLLTAGIIASSSVSAASHSQSANSELVLLLQQLQNEVRQLRGEVETQQYRLQKLEKEQLERYRDVDRRLSSVLLQQADTGQTTLTESTSTESAVAEPSERPEQTAPQVVSADTGVTPDAQMQTDEPIVSDRVAYQQAFTLVRERKFDEAIASFEQFVVAYPSSDNLANAYYWIGEVKLAQQDLAPAQSAFETVVNQFLTHRKRPDALYKLGVVQDRLGNKSGLEASFKLLIDEYPTSSAAGLARNYKSR